MTTVREICTGAGKLLGVVRKSEQLDADEANDAFNALNQLLDSWSNESLITSATTLESFNLSATGTYTIGDGGDFDTDRPINIIDAYVRTGNVDYPLEIIPEEVYDQYINYKTVQSSIPQYMTYSNAYPLATITLWPIPTSGTSLKIRTLKAMTQFTSIDTDVALPPGWERALRYNLAIELAPEYGVQLDPIVVKNAMEAKGNIKLAVAKNRDMSSLVDQSRRRNILTDR